MGKSLVAYFMVIMLKLSHAFPRNLNNIMENEIVLKIVPLFQAKQTLISKYEEAAQLSEEVNSLKAEVGEC